MEPLALHSPPQPSSSSLRELALVGGWWERCLEEEQLFGPLSHLVVYRVEGPATYKIGFQEKRACFLLHNPRHQDTCWVPPAPSPLGQEMGKG